MKSSKIKDTILKTGIPLEISVVNKILKYDLDELGEVEYEREGKIFSTDIHTEKQFKISKNMYILFNFVIECKYKTKNHNWFFMQFPRGNNYSMRSDARNEVFDVLFRAILKKIGCKFDNIKKISELRVRNFFDVKVADKAVEVINDKFDPNTIKKALHQAVFGSVVIHKDSMHYILESLPLELDSQSIQDFYKNKDDVAPLISVTLPIIVTTAKLYRLQEDISLEDIENEKDISNIFEEEKGMLLFNLNHETVWKFSNEIFKKEPLPIDDATINLIRSSDKYFNTDRLHNCNPGYVYIINYEHFDELFSKCLLKIEQICEEISENLLEISK